AALPELRRRAPTDRKYRCGAARQAGRGGARRAGLTTGQRRRPRRAATGAEAAFRAPGAAEVHRHAGLPPSGSDPRGRRGRVAQPEAGRLGALVRERPAAPPALVERFWAESVERFDAAAAG